VDLVYLVVAGVRLLWNPNCKMSYARKHFHPLIAVVSRV
jgi:hypothetical protein